MGVPGNFTALLLVITASMVLQGTTAVEYTVGDSFGWAVPRGNDRDFYKRWTSNKTFHAGDTFVFNWSGNHTVTERNKEEFDLCNTNGGIDVVTSGLRRTLARNGTYYYICKVDDHCQQGQKIRLVIGDGENDDENNSNNSSGAIFGSNVEIFAASVTALIMYLF